MKLDLFQSCGHCWAFQICCHIECSTFTASAFRIWNSSTGIPLPPLALFIVMLPMAHLISHSRMSVFMWVITPSQLSRSLRSLLYSSSVYSCHFLMLGPYHFCPLLSPSYMKYFLGSSRSLEEISSLPFCCFPLFLCTDCWGRLSYLSLLFFGTLYLDAYIFPFLLCL